MKRQFPGGALARAGVAMARRAADALWLARNALAQARALPPKTALLYPVMLADRLGLLLDTGSARHRRTVGVDTGSVQSSARAFAKALRHARPALMRTDGFAWPFYWAPFILIGSWL